MDEEPGLVGETLYLRASQGALSGGTPMVVHEEGDTWVVVHTAVAMPHIKGHEMFDNRPLIELPKSALVKRRLRAQNISMR